MSEIVKQHMEAVNQGIQAVVDVLTASSSVYANTKHIALAHIGYALVHLAKQAMLLEGRDADDIARTMEGFEARAQVEMMRGSS